MDREEIAAFEARWHDGLSASSGSPTLYAGQRGSDVRKMVWTDIVGTTIRVASKTGTKLVLPLHSDSQALLALAPKKRQRFCRHHMRRGVLTERLRQFRISSDSIRWSACAIQKPRLS